MRRDRSSCLRSEFVIPWWHCTAQLPIRPRQTITLNYRYNSGTALARGAAHTRLSINISSTYTGVMLPGCAPATHKVFCDGKRERQIRLAVTWRYLSDSTLTCRSLAHITDRN